MHLQKLYSLTRQAIEQQHMISAGDRVAVGLSGGKDSITLLYAMSGLSKFYSKPFELEAITVDLGFGMDFSTLELLCDRLKIRYHVISTDIKEIVFDLRKENNPCSLCANLRKGALNAKAVELGCNKIAYAHHRDDFIQTFFMSMLMEGRLHTLSPYFQLEKTGLYLMRPLYLVSEGEIKSFIKRQDIEVIRNRCPQDGISKRAQMDDLVRKLAKDYPDIRKKVFHALQAAEFDDWKSEMKNRNRMDPC